MPVIMSAEVQLNKYTLTDISYIEGSVKNIDNDRIGSTTKHININTLQVIKNWHDYGILEIDFGTSFYDFENMAATYATSASQQLLYHTGVAVNMDYDNSGSGAAVEGVYPSAEYALENFFKYNENIITNFEMETSALYYLGQTLGHNTLTICAIIGNRLTKEYSEDYKKTVSKMIDLVLSRIC